MALRETIRFFTSGGSYVATAVLQLAPRIFTKKILFRSVYCFILIFKFALTRMVDNVPSPKLYAPS